jgi:hypothetical protein
MSFHTASAASRNRTAWILARNDGLNPLEQLSYRSSFALGCCVSRAILVFNRLIKSKIIRFSGC